MPLFYQQNINPTTKLAIWHIEETEEFFSGTVPLQRDISHPHKRLQHLAGRFLLRYLFPDFPYQEILIADTLKPYLQNEQYHFSISHCGDYAAAIVSKSNRVGIDIELVTPRIEKIAPKFLSIEEHILFNNKYVKNKQLAGSMSEVSDSLNNISLLTLIWSTKEAVFKWWGNGDVDFSERIKTQVNQLQEHGSFTTIFNDAFVETNYCFFNKLCLTWVMS